MLNIERDRDVPLHAMTMNINLTSTSCRQGGQIRTANEPLKTKVNYYSMRLFELRNQKKETNKGQNQMNFLHLSKVLSLILHVHWTR